MTRSARLHTTTTTTITISSPDGRRQSPNNATDRNYKTFFYLDAISLASWRPSTLEASIVAHCMGGQRRVQGTSDDEVLKAGACSSFLLFYRPPQQASSRTLLSTLLAC